MSELLHFLLSNEAQFRSARLGSLYSDFRLQQASNPDGFNANVNAWEVGLSHALRAGLIPGGEDILSLRTGELLLQALESRDYGRPLALEALIDVGVSRKSLISIQSFLESPTSIYHQSWTTTCIRFLSRGLHQLQLGEQASAKRELPNGQFVMVKTVEDAASKVISKMSERLTRSDRILPMEIFKKEASKALGHNKQLTEDDLEILLVFLDRERQYLIYDGQVVKIRQAGGIRPKITSQDKTIASLQSLILDLNAQIQELLEKMNRLTQEARGAIAQGNRSSAQSSLRLKNLHGSMFTRRSESLLQLENTYSKIAEAADQIEVVKAIEAGTQTLKFLNAEIGGLETVEDVIEGLRDEMVKVDEIGSVLTQVTAEGDVVDEEAINDEFETLLNQERSNETAAQETRQRLDLIDQIPLSDAPKISALGNSMGHTQKSDATDLQQNQENDIAKDVLEPGGYTILARDADEPQMLLS